MGKNVIHISETEAASDFRQVLAQVRRGVEIIIERDKQPVAIVSPVATRPGRLLSEAIAMAESRGSTVTLDGDFARDLESVIDSHREPLSPPAWE